MRPIGCRLLKWSVSGPDDGPKRTNLRKIQKLKLKIKFKTAYYTQSRLFNFVSDRLAQKWHSRSAWLDMTGPLGVLADSSNDLFHVQMMAQNVRIGAKSKSLSSKSNSKLHITRKIARSISSPIYKLESDAHVWLGLVWQVTAPTANSGNWMVPRRMLRYKFACPPLHSPSRRRWRGNAQDT